MPGRVSIGKSTHGLTSVSGSTGSQSLVSSNPAPVFSYPKKSAAKTTLLNPSATSFLPKHIRRPLNAFERAVIAFDPVKTVKKAVTAAASAVKKFFSGW